MKLPIGRFVGVGILSALTPVLAHADFIGATFTGDAVRISDSGVLTRIGPTGRFDLSGMATDADGHYLANTLTGALINIDPITGAGSLFGSAAIGDLRSIAFLPGSNSILFGADGGGGARSRIWRINVPLGNAQLIGDVPGVIQGLDFHPNGTLYGWNNSFGLVTINTATAEMTDVNPALPGNTVIQTLSFAPDGTLFGARDALYRFDLSTGAPTKIGSGWNTDFDVRGIGYIPAPASILPLLFTLLPRRRRLC